MLAAIKRKFNDIRFGRKLLLSHLIVALIPIILLGLLSFFQSYRIQMKELRSESQASLNQVKSILDYKINRYNMLCEFMVLNREFSAVFIQSYGDHYFNIYLNLRDVLDPMVAHVKLMDENIENITFYTSGELLGIRSNILPLEELKAKPWYEGVRGRQWVVFDGHVYLVQELISNLKDSNFMVISINYNSIFADMGKLSDTIQASIVNPRGDFIYQGPSVQAAGTGNGLTPPSAERISGTLNNIGWTIQYDILSSHAYRNAMSIFTITLFVILISLVITFFLIYIFSGNYTRRIIRLKTKVDKVEQNNLDEIIQSSSKDEIGELTNGIGKMLARINSLIFQVYQAEIAKKESDYNKLINQINPHFLYNTLSFIHWRALGKQDLETGYMVTALARFYRTTLNKGRDFAPVADEIEHIKAYLELQSVMNEDSFEVEYRLDESILDHKIIHFLLQPIVENAIKHGFSDMCTEPDRLIILSAGRVEERLVLAVSDNGCGMTAKRKAMLLSGDSGGCGVRNVHDRIQLYYGKAYGLQVESEPGRGTTVQLSLPYEETATK